MSTEDVLGKNPTKKQLSCTPEQLPWAMQDYRIQTEYLLPSLSNCKGTCRVSLNKKPTCATCFNNKLLQGSVFWIEKYWENPEDAAKEKNANNCWTISFKISCVTSPVLPSWQCTLSNKWHNKNMSIATYSRTNPGTVQYKFESSFHRNQETPSHWFGKCLIICYFLPSLEKIPQITPYSICFNTKPLYIHCH